MPRALHMGNRRRVLMLTHRVPYPPDRGDRIRAYHLLRQLGRHVDVSLACVSDEPVSDDQRAVLGDLTTQLAIQPIHRAGKLLRAAGAIATGGPITPAVFFRRSLAHRIERWHWQMPFDAVLTFCTGMMEYALRLQLGKQRPRHVLDLVDVDSIKWARFAAVARPPMRWVYAREASRLVPLERGGDWVDAITVVSDHEARAYRHEVGLNTNLHVVGNGVDLDYFHPLSDAPANPDHPQQQVVSFVGVLDYRPNVEGITWFVNEVWPLVRQRNRRAVLRIIGRRPSAPVTALSRREGVEVIGPVDDVRTHLAASTAVVAPLLIAPGVQNKVLEAMASARAVVCTPGAAAGIDAASDEHLLVADQPTAFAHHVLRMLGDTARRTRLAADARRRVEQRYRWDAMLEPMIELITGRLPTAAACPRAA